MRKITYLLALVAAMVSTGVQADSETEGNLYMGVGIGSLALDNDRVPGVPTSSPSHSSKTGRLIIGYRFNDLWSVDASFGTDVSDNVDTDVFAVNGYRFFARDNWRPYLSAGFSSFSIDSAPDDDTQQVQAGFGISGDLNRNLELRAGYQVLFTINDESFQDNNVYAALAWHFRKPEAVVVSQPAPEPESVPVEKEIVDTFELLVLFDFDKSIVKSVYEPQFEEIVRVLKESPDITMTIEGHTDWIGTEKYNQGLSERRADAVKQMFVAEHGIEPERIATEGYGEARPVADNATSAGRRRNRRAISVVLRPRIVTE
ncbi:MAG: Outer membrane porin F [Gammaproteobacteria bacterium]|nr:Outer membrane porin F [Gammaproteobacteria bacterium]